MNEVEGLGSNPLTNMEPSLHQPAPGVHMLQFWSNVCIFETDDGVVIFDAGFIFTGPRTVEELRKITDKPVRYIIYGHGHADHAFGTPAILDDAEKRGYPRPLIVAHSNLPVRFDRYQHMLSYHAHINRIQLAIPDKLPAFVETYIYPDLTYESSMKFTLGGQDFMLSHSRGETDDTTWMWVPDKKVVAVSDLWVWSCPNIGNPFKVQRYELEWAEGLERIAGREPEVLLPGHGPPIIGAEEIQKACTTVAKALRFLHHQVVDMLNQGKWQEEILHSFEWPKEFSESPYLRPIYGHPYFVVQAILRRYHGWFDGNATNLFPEKSSEVAQEVIGLLGDPEVLLNRAGELKEKGREQLGLHLVDLVINGGSGTQRKNALQVKVDLLKALAEREESLIARNIFRAGVRETKKELEKLKVE